MGMYVKARLGVENMTLINCVIMITIFVDVHCIL